MPESASQSQRIAVIGLGSMGFGMATSLRRAGFEVTGCDVSDDAVARFVSDGGKCDTGNMQEIFALLARLNAAVRVLMSRVAPRSIVKAVSRLPLGRVPAGPSRRT